ncbi:peptidase S24/S26A/S26B/S26C [Baffinella frigidus]|nr:peptidase S24/S26A/S26B/S26C [Cryptophyta sp. CCMP2293]
MRRSGLAAFVRSRLFSNPNYQWSTQDVLQAAKHCLFALPVVLVANDCVVSVAKVEGRSMQPTLNPDEQGPRDRSARASPPIRDRVLIDKFSYSCLREYKRGDVCLLRSPRDPDAWIIKRLVALEGDTVRTHSQEFVHVPQGRCWMEGDNQECSDDSERTLGAVPLALVEGRVLSVIWPPWRIHRVPRVFSQERVSLGYHHAWP